LLCVLQPAQEKPEDADAEETKKSFDAPALTTRETQYKNNENGFNSMQVGLETSLHSESMLNCAE
jgi:hypothetical protein